MTHTTNRITTIDQDIQHLADIISLAKSLDGSNALGPIYMWMRELLSTIDKQRDTFKYTPMPTNCPTRLTSVFEDLSTLSLAYNHIEKGDKYEAVALLKDWRNGLITL